MFLISLLPEFHWIPNIGPAIVDLCHVNLSIKSLSFSPFQSCQILRSKYVILSILSRLLSIRNFRLAVPHHRLTDEYADFLMQHVVQHGELKLLYTGRKFLKTMINTLKVISGRSPERPEIVQMIILILQSSVRPDRARCQHGALKTNMSMARPALISGQDVLIGNLAAPNAPQSKLCNYGIIRNYIERLF